MSRFDDDPIFELVSEPDEVDGDPEEEGITVTLIVPVPAGKVDDFLRHPKSGGRRERPQR